jgi:hypothetical protein
MIFRLFVTAALFITSIPCFSESWTFWVDLKNGNGKYYRSEKFYQSGTNKNIYFQDVILDFNEEQKMDVNGKVQLVKSMKIYDEINCEERSVTRKWGIAFTGQMATGFELGTVYLPKEKQRLIYSESDWGTKGFKIRYCKSFFDFLK